MVNCIYKGCSTTAPSEVISYTSPTSNRRYELIDNIWTECDTWYWKEWLVAIILLIVILILI